LESTVDQADRIAPFCYPAPFLLPLHLPTTKSSVFNAVIPLLWILQAIWLRKAKDITDEEYNKFYKAVSKVRGQG
jgi:hypothetical protein